MIDVLINAVDEYQKKPIDAFWDNLKASECPDYLIESGCNLLDKFKENMKIIISKLIDERRSQDDITRFILYLKDNGTISGISPEWFDEIEIAAEKRGVTIDLSYQFNLVFDFTRLDMLKNMPYADYLKTSHWNRTRKKALQRSGYKCQLCSQKGRMSVHHNNYSNRGEEKDNDLVVLCDHCHAKFHDKLTSEKANE